MREYRDGTVTTRFWRDGSDPEVDRPFFEQSIPMSRRRPPLPKREWHIPRHLKHRQMAPAALRWPQKIG